MGIKVYLIYHVYIYEAKTKKNKNKTKQNKKTATKNPQRAIYHWIKNHFQVGIDILAAVNQFMNLDTEILAEATQLDNSSNR